MISGALRFEGFDARSWTNLVSLLRSESTQPRSTLIILVDASDIPLYAFTTEGVKVSFPSVALTHDLEKISLQYNAHQIIVLRLGALEMWNERIAKSVKLSSDFMGQLLVLAKTFRELRQEGQIRVWPATFAQIPLPTAPMVDRAFDIFLPNDRSALLAVWQDRSLWTALAIRRKGGQIDAVLGPDILHRWSGVLSGDFRRDSRVVSQAVSQSLAPLRVGLFCEAHTLKKLISDPEPGAWAKAVALRNIVIHPMPKTIAAAIAADAARAVAKRSADWTGWDPLAPLINIAYDVRNQISSLASISNTLGFNPLKLLALALSNNRRRD